MSKSYKSTILACYIGNFVMSSAINVLPILFMTLHTLYAVSYEKLGLLVMVNFVTQITFDISFSGIIDKYGFRRFVVVAPLFCFVGLLLFASSPKIFPHDPYIGFVIAVIVSSIGCGLLEILLSPIVNCIPSNEKVSAMNLLHSFYSWGQLTVALVTSLTLRLIGNHHWQYILLFWAIVPLVCSVLFTRVPIVDQHTVEHMKPSFQIIKQLPFILCIVMIFSGASSEVGMSQWASAFMERGLGISKTVGDVAGICFFAAMMGVGRALGGKYGGKIKLLPVMLLGGLAAAICYTAVATSSIPVISLLACGLCGICVSLMWPGTLMLASQNFPMAGSWLFALLTAGGNIGAAFGPFLMGKVTDNVTGSTKWTAFAANLHMTSEQLGFRAAMLTGAIFPVIVLFTALALMVVKKKRATKLQG